jgi:Na+-translocating ferredoxin:NAD+ oxidoreductase subunit G
MKEYFKLGTTLAIITAITGLLLGFSYNLTKDAIAASGNVSKDDLKVIMPVADIVKPATVKGEKGDVIQEVIPAYKGNDLVGHVIKVSSKGFHGEILTLVAISQDGKVTGVKLLSHSETPGVGSKTEKPDFLNRFANKSTDSELQVVKVAPSKDNEVQGVSGATVSSKAVTSGVNEAIKYFNENLKGKGGN